MDGRKQCDGKADSNSTHTEGEKDKTSYLADCREGIPDGMSMDAAPSYDMLPPLPGSKKQGEYTLEDYLALPSDERWELIDGCLIRMESPGTEHQLISGGLQYAFSTCIREHDAPCVVLAAPMDVQLDMDDRTVVEPDLIILCDRKKLGRKRIFGAPDLLVEILSPATRSRDVLWKNSKYQKAGVREYWMVDPMEKKVIVNRFDETEGEFRSRIYEFEEKIPVGISDGNCTIDFAVIARELDEVYGTDRARSAP